MFGIASEYFIKLRNLIYERTGIRYEENKIYYIKKRLTREWRRAVLTGLKTISDI